MLNDRLSLHQMLQIKWIKIEHHQRREKLISLSKPNAKESRNIVKCCHWERRELTALPLRSSNVHMCSHTAASASTSNFSTTIASGNAIFRARQLGVFALKLDLSYVATLSDALTVSDRAKNTKRGTS